MNNLDEQAWQREFDHVEAKQNQKVEVIFGDITQEKAQSMVDALKHFNAAAKELAK